MRGGCWAAAGHGEQDRTDPSEDFHGETRAVSLRGGALAVGWWTRGWWLRRGGAQEEGDRRRWRPQLHSKTDLPAFTPADIALPEPPNDEPGGQSHAKLAVLSRLVELGVLALYVEDAVRASPPAGVAR
jgi:hypothetical protein